jgi:hypothetical protein
MKCSHSIGSTCDCGITFLAGVLQGLWADALMLSGWPLFTQHSSAVTLCSGLSTIGSWHGLVLLGECLIASSAVEQVKLSECLVIAASLMLVLAQKDFAACSSIELRNTAGERCTDM